MSGPALIVLFVVLYRVAVLGVCAYAVFWLGHSGWWFLLALMLCGSDEARPTSR